MMFMQFLFRGLKNVVLLLEGVSVRMQNLMRKTKAHCLEILRCKKQDLGNLT